LKRFDFNLFEMQQHPAWRPERGLGEAGAGMSFTIAGPNGPSPVGAIAGSGTPAPAVAAIGSGRWVAVWQADNTVEARVFNADGTPLGASFLVAPDASLGGARVAALANGGFGVTWAADPAGGSNTDIFVRRYDKDGDPIDPAPIPAVEHDPDGGAPKGNVTPDIAGLPNGGLVVTWTGAGFGTGPDIYMRPFDSAGGPGKQAFARRRSLPSSKLRLGSSPSATAGPSLRTQANASG
jgi:hypothetical protein